VRLGEHNTAVPVSPQIQCGFRRIIVTHATVHYHCLVKFVCMAWWITIQCIGQITVRLCDSLHRHFMLQLASHWSHSASLFLWTGMTKYPLPFRLHRMHEMLCILTDVRGVCLSVCLSVTRLKSAAVRAVYAICRMRGVIRYSLCQMPLASCLSHRSRLQMVTQWLSG